MNLNELLTSKVKNVLAPLSSSIVKDLAESKKNKRVVFSTVRKYVDFDNKKNVFVTTRSNVTVVASKKCYIEINATIEKATKLWYHLCIQNKINSDDYNNNNIGIKFLMLNHVDPATPQDLVDITQKLNMLEKSGVNIYIKSYEYNDNDIHRHIVYLKHYMELMGITNFKINLYDKYSVKLAKLMTYKSLIQDVDEVGEVEHFEYVGEYLTKTNEKNSKTLVTMYKPRYKVYNRDVIINIIDDYEPSTKGLSPEAKEIAILTDKDKINIASYLSAVKIIKRLHLNYARNRIIIKDKKTYHEDNVLEEKFKRFFNVDYYDKESFKFFAKRIEDKDYIFLPLKYDKDEFIEDLTLFGFNQYIIDNCVDYGEEHGIFIEDEVYYENSNKDDDGDDENEEI